MFRGAEVQFFRCESSSPTVPRRCNVFTKEQGGREEAKECTYLSIFQTDVRQRVILCATRCIRSTWESQSAPEIDREATGLARVLPRRLPSTFVALAAFIDGKSVVDSRSKISVKRPEERCHLSCRRCRRFTWHMEEFVRKDVELDRQISRGCLARH